MEKVFGIFKVWDEEVDRFMAILRDINKKSRNSKFVCRFSNHAQENMLNRLKSVKKYVSILFNKFYASLPPKSFISPLYLFACFILVFH